MEKKGIESYGLSDGDPFRLFGSWYNEMKINPAGEPTAMILSTATSSGNVSSRVVLLKSFDSSGFVFFSNYLSRKAFQIETNPGASLLFYWPNQQRQVRIEGLVQKISEEQSDAYFKQRPIESRIGAWASEQSSEIESRSVLEERYKMFSERFGNDIPRPSHWGGYLLVPDMIEFWQEGEHRLHDRIVYKKAKVSWSIKRLAP
jgi:pyridoxamine 5'-phosphate oxidase